VLEEALSEVTPIEEILGPTSAYQHELEWLKKGRNQAAGPILASRAGLDASMAKVPRGAQAGLFGPFGRTRILAQVGHLEAALGLAQSVVAGADEREQVIRGLKADLASRSADVGEVDHAVQLALEANPDGERVAGAVAREIAERVDEDGLDHGISLLEQLQSAYPDDPTTAVSLARLLNRRAVMRANGDKATSTYLPDLERAVKLDPDSIQVRGNLAQSYFKRAANTFERDPRAAMADLRRAVSADPNSSQVREAGASLAMACGATYAGRRDRSNAMQCIEYALELDPTNHEAYRAAMMLR
jgi:tetratricopeptide (TPR) repeat protein